MPPQLSPPPHRPFSRSSQPFPTPPTGGDGGEPLAQPIPKASTSTSSTFDLSLPSRSAGRQYEDYRHKSQRERPNHDNQRLPPRQTRERERTMVPRFSSRSRSPLASPPIGQPSRRNRRPSRSPPPFERRRSPSPLAHAYQDPLPQFLQADQEHLSSRPSTPPTPGVPDTPTSNNSLTANQMQTQILNQNQNQNRSNHLPNVSQTTSTSSLPPQTSRPSQPTQPTTGPLPNPTLRSRPSQLPSQLSPASQSTQSTQSTQPASALSQTTMRPVPIAVPLTGHGAPHPRITPASGPSAAQVRPPNLSLRLSQPAQQVALPLSQPARTQAQYPPSPSPNESETARRSSAMPPQLLTQPQPQPQPQIQPQSQSQSQSQHRIQPSPQRPPYNIPAAQTSQASNSTHSTLSVKPLSSQSKGSTAVNTSQKVNQGATVPPLTGTGTDQHQHQLDMKNREAISGADAGVGAIAGDEVENSSGTNQSQGQNQIKSEDKKDNNNKGQKKNAGKKKGKGKIAQNGAKIVKVEVQKGELLLKSENQERDQKSRNGTTETKEEKTNANLTIERGEHGEKDKVDQKEGQAQKEMEKPIVIPEVEAETRSSSQRSLHFPLPVVDSLPLPIHHAQPEHARLTESLPPIQPVRQPDHSSQSYQPSDSSHLPLSLPFPQADTLGLASTPDVLTAPGVFNEQGLSPLSNGSMQFPLLPSHALASSSSLSSPDASIRSVKPLQPLQSTMPNSGRGARSSTEHEHMIPSLPGQIAHVPSTRPDAHPSITSPSFLRMPPISSPSTSPHNLSSQTLTSSSTAAGHVSVPMREKEKEKEKDQIEVDQNDSQAGKIGSVDKGKGKERLGETQGAGLFTVAGAVPLSFWVYGGPRARTLEIVITVSPVPPPIYLSIHPFLIFWTSFLLCHNADNPSPATIIVARRWRCPHFPNPRWISYSTFTPFFPYK